MSIKEENKDKELPRPSKELEIAILDLCRAIEKCRKRVNIKDIHFIEEDAWSNRKN